MGGHLRATPDASVSTRMATGNTVCSDGERTGLDDAFVASAMVCVCLRNCEDNHLVGSVEVCFA